MKYILALVVVLLMGCAPSWSDGPYEVYWIDGVKSLGFKVGDGAYIERIQEPQSIAANEKYLSVYACPEKSCAYYYIDWSRDHKFAESTDFVFGPYTKEEFSSLQREKLLPQLSAK